jgi:ATP-dependent RNA helicase DDX23/PRP28
MKPEPLSIETLLQKQREERDAALKVFLIRCHLKHLTSIQQPKFFSKEERAKLAIGRRLEEIKGQREKEEQAKQDREALEREAEEIRQKGRGQQQQNRFAGGGKEQRYARQGRDNRRNPQSVRPGFHNVPTAPRAERSKQATPALPGSTNDSPAAPGTPVGSSTPTPMPQAPPPSTLPDSSKSAAPSMTEDEISAIRSRYLGVDKKKRRIRKINDRKFVFDWDAQDDTLADGTPASMGANRQGAQVMFGRGHLAGMDDGGSDVRKKSLGADGVNSARLADVIERRKAAKQGIDERHWTDKPLTEMKERDWRIFREDFSITARGSSYTIFLNENN